MNVFKHKAALYITGHANCDILDFCSGVGENSGLVGCCTVCNDNEDSTLKYIDRMLRVYAT